jgi:ABC-type sulfate/molybdate transport systems ATPase subunit
LPEVVEMNEFANTKAKYLSGGQMQRVALARVLAIKPEVLLLDEPFSHIDNFRKNSLRRKIFSYLKENNITTIIATHDSTDVLSFADEVVVMQSGTIIRHEMPKDLFENPQIKYVASLFDDVNEIETPNGVELVYPHQLKVVSHSDFKVQVKKSYYRGNYFLIESDSAGKPIFFIHPTEIKSNEFVFLSK